MIQFVIFGKNHYQYNGFDINRYIYSDAISQGNVLYIEPKESVWSRYLLFFYRNKYGMAIRRKLFIPFRNTAYQALLQKRSRIRKTDDIIFVFFLTEPWFFGKKGFLAFLRKRYPHGKLVYHITNVIQNVRNKPERLRQYFDLVTTCNKGDSVQYALPLFPNSCSYIPFDDNCEPRSDCLFVGQAKNRLNDLTIIFDLLTQKGVRCEFYINGVKEEDKRFADKIHYNQTLDYDVILKKTERTNVVLELLQEGMDTYTLRFPEAVTYGRKLITNNSAVIHEKSYSPENIRVIRQASDIASIETSFFSSPSQIPYPNRDAVSSRHFLTFLLDHLAEQTMRSTK